jgi:hypothetical protein
VQAQELAELDETDSEVEAPFGLALAKTENWSSFLLLPHLGHAIVSEFERTRRS